MTEYMKKKVAAEKYVFEKFKDEFAYAKEAVKKSRALWHWKEKNKCSYPTEEMKKEAFEKKAKFNFYQDIVKNWNNLFKEERYTKMVELGAFDKNKTDK